MKSRFFSLSLIVTLFSLLLVLRNLLSVPLVNLDSVPVCRLLLRDWVLCASYYVLWFSPHFFYRVRAIMFLYLFLRSPEVYRGSTVSSSSEISYIESSLLYKNLAYGRLLVYFYNLKRAPLLLLKISLRVWSYSVSYWHLFFYFSIWSLKGLR